MSVDRLSSFLYQKGELDSSKITPITNHVFHVKTSSMNDVILKRYREEYGIDQQWKFFNRIHSSIITPFQPFPNGKQSIKWYDYYWTIAPYVQGKTLNYAFHEGRIAAVDTLRTFHRIARGVQISNPITRDMFYMRWLNRLQSFKKTDDIFVEFGFEELFQDIIRTTEAQFYAMTRLPWKKLQENAEYNWTWAHGDVASHNFIQSRKTHLIDFDLLHRTPEIHDYIQLGQRFLPHLNWELNDLISYQMVDEKEQGRWLVALMVPTDLMRDWLHLLFHGSSLSIDTYLTKMELEWEKRQSFLKRAKIMLKSL